MKNWYSKERLESFKYLVKNGCRTQKDYDELENQLKSFNLDEKEIVDKVVEAFVLLPENEETAFTYLLSQTFSLNALAFFEDEALWKMYDMFLKECKNRKIKIVFREYEGPVGIPYNLGLWRTDKPLITKIIYNAFYGCWGMRGELSRTYVVFEKHKITYCSEPLDRESNKRNCLIKISYDPTNYYEYDEPIDELERYDFENICHIAKSIDENHTVDERVCDAIPASVVICYDDKKKKVVAGLGSEETRFIEKIANSFAPNSFKKAIGFDAEEDEHL